MKPLAVAEAEEALDLIDISVGRSIWDRLYKNTCSIQ